jgi:hypothetical protein
MLGRQSWIELAEDLIRRESVISHVQTSGDTWPNRQSVISLALFELWGFHLALKLELEKIKHTKVRCDRHTER